MSANAISGAGEAGVFLRYSDVATTYSLGVEFHDGCQEIWSLVKDDLGEMRRFMQDGIAGLCLKEQRPRDDQPPQDAAAVEAARSVQTWLRGQADQVWLNDCHELITRHVGQGAPTLALSGMKTWGTRFLIAVLRVRCRDIDQFSRLVQVMATLSSVQDAIIAFTHQKYLQSVMQARLSDQAERLRTEIAETVAEANHKSHRLRGQIEELARFTRTTVLGNREIANISDEIVSAMSDAADHAADLISGIDQAKVSVSDAAAVALAASSSAQAAVDTASGLPVHTDAISSILNLIKEVASQTNTLALNAAIEAARAGDMGRGFAVVAQEVKALAGQTSQATGQISEQIGSIQSAARAAITAMSKIHRGVSEVHGETDRISLAMSGHARGATRISDALRHNAETAASTSRKLLEMGDATEMAAAQLTGIDNAFFEIADHLQILHQRVIAFTSEISRGEG